MNRFFQLALLFLGISFLQCSSMGNIPRSGAVTKEGPQANRKTEKMPAALQQADLVSYEYAAGLQNSAPYGFQIRLIPGGMILLPESIGNALQKEQPLPVENWRAYATIIKRKDQVGWAFGHLGAFSPDEETLHALFSTGKLDAELILVEDTTADRFHLCDLVSEVGTPTAEVWIERTSGTPLIQIIPKLVARQKLSQPKKISLKRDERGIPPKIEITLFRPLGGEQRQSLSDPTFSP